MNAGKEQDLQLRYARIYTYEQDVPTVRFDSTSIVRIVISPCSGHKP
jgi:hypothetical protein